MKKIALVLLILPMIGFGLARTRGREAIDIHEEIYYDSFGVVKSVRSAGVELKPDWNGKILIKHSAAVKNGCELTLKPKIPEVFDAVVTTKTAMPITSSMVLTDGKSYSEVEVELKKRDMNQDDVGTVRSYDKNKVDDDLLDFSIESEEIKNATKSMNTSKNVLELLEDIKTYVKSHPKNDADCDDYAILFVAIGRTLGIQARTAFNSKHMWVEVCVPMKNSSCKWIAIDPTDSGDVSYTISLDLEPSCENSVVEDEIWMFE